MLYRNKVTLHLSLAATTVLTFRAAPTNVVTTKSYTIQHCSLFASRVQDALEKLYDVLLPAIWQTHYGVESAPYKAFFKSSYYEIVVENILKEILIGALLILKPNKQKLIPTLV